MILTAHQPTYLPWLGLFHKIAISDEYCFFDDVQYLVRDWNNRNKIKTANGDIWLTVPVLNKGYLDKKIREIEINNSLNWRDKHWKSIYLSYKKAPYFNLYSDFFEDVYKKDWLYVTDLCEYMMKWLLKELKINVKYYKASELNFEGYKSSLVLDMCKNLNADTYIFGKLGADYVDVESFTKENVNIYIQEYKHPEYNQLWGGFKSNMSIIDLLFNMGPNSLDILMQNNITKEELNNMFNYK